MDWSAAAWFAAAGIVAAALGSFAPARSAARLAPAAALKSGDTFDAKTRLPLLGPLALGAGAALAFLPPVQGLPLFGYAAIALLLLGTLHALPGFGQALLALAPVPRAAPASLAIRHLRHAQSQTRLSLAAIVAAVALMSAMTVMVASFRGSLQTWLGQVLPADLYVRAGTGGDTAYLPSSTQQALMALPDVQRVEFLRATSVLLDVAEPRVVLLAREVDPSQPALRLPLVGAFVTPSAGQPPPAWISEAVADRRGWRVGQEVRLPIGARSVAFTVAGIWRDYARQQGAIVIGRDTYAQLTGDDRVTDAAVWLRARRRPRAHPRRRAGDRRRRSQRDRDTRRAARDVAAHLRSHVRRHLCAGGRRGADRPHRTVVVVRRTGARAPPRVRHAAPRRHDAPPGRRDARRPKASRCPASASSPA